MRLDVGGKPLIPKVAQPVIEVIESVEEVVHRADAMHCIELVPVAAQVEHVVFGHAMVVEVIERIPANHASQPAHFIVEVRLAVLDSPSVSALFNEESLF